MNAADAAWFYALGGEQKGPVTRSDLQSLIVAGVVRPDTLVWADGMPVWTPARQTELAPLFGLEHGRPAGPAGPAAPLGFPSFHAGVAGGGPAPPLSFGAAVRRCLGAYATFSGRASRSEFWFFFLFGVLAILGADVVEALLGGGTRGNLSSLVSLGLFLPNLAVGARRLHDIGRTGWWQLLVVLPVFGFVALVVLWCQRPDPEPNRYG